MTIRKFCEVSIALAIAVFFLPGAVSANTFTQCPGDTDGDAIPEVGAPGYDPNVRCMHVVGADGFVNMADDKLQYIFSFGDITGTPENQVVGAGILAAEFPAPTIELRQGEEFYLTMTNVGMAQRPDLFDPHTIHFHGFPNASAIYDGVPDASVSINMGASISYYYNLVKPGTFMYHCHVEATEHMQMGMLGNLYVSPAQDGTQFTYAEPGETGPGRTFNQFVYNDGDGSTGFDVEFPIQIGSFDPDFHDASMNTQPLPFAEMRDRYAMLNGRGYPDTVLDGNPDGPAQAENGGIDSQPVDSIITATQGQKILLRISNLNVTRFYTLATEGLTMRIVGRGSDHLRGPTGTDFYYETSSVNLGGGEALEAIIDTADVAPGTYFLYTTNMQYLSNDAEDFGGMMTEITILPSV